MKLSEILGWEKKEYKGDTDCQDFKRIGYNTALTSCDREIDREALAKILWKYFHQDPTDSFEFEAAEIISTMPNWLKRIEK